jgi:hypothetical protein
MHRIKRDIGRGGEDFMPIPLRPGAPMQRGYPPRMMNTRHYSGPHIGGGYNQVPMMNRPMMNTPMMGRNSGKQGGGLLSKILGRTKQGGPGGGIPSFSRGVSSGGGGGGILQSLTNPETLNGFLNNTQAVLKTAQQLGPMIEQYGPLVRNLPSLWKLYRGLKDANNDSPSDKTDDNSSDESSKEMELMEIKPIVNENTSQQNETKQSRHHNRPLSKDYKRSKPKLFI